MDVLDLQTPREIHVFNRGYQMGWDHCEGGDVDPTQDSEVAFVDPASASLLSPEGPSPDGDPPTGSKQTLPPSAPTSSDPDPDSVISWGTEDNVEGLAQSLGFLASSGFDGWGTTPEGDDLNKDPLDACDYNEGFIDGLKLAMECAQAHENGSEVYAHMVKDLADLLALFEAIAS